MFETDEALSNSWGRKQREGAQHQHPADHPHQETEQYASETEPCDKAGNLNEARRTSQPEDLTVSQINSSRFVRLTARDLKYWHDEEESKHAPALGEIPLKHISNIMPANRMKSTSDFFVRRFESRLELGTGKRKMKNERWESSCLGLKMTRNAMHGSPPSCIWELRQSRTTSTINSTSYPLRLHPVQQTRIVLKKRGFKTRVCFHFELEPPLPLVEAQLVLLFEGRASLEAFLTKVDSVS